MSHLPLDPEDAPWTHEAREQRDQRRRLWEDLHESDYLDLESYPDFTHHG